MKNKEPELSWFAFLLVLLLLSIVMPDPNKSVHQRAISSMVSIAMFIGSLVGIYFIVIWIWELLKTL